ncbi:prolyl-tRNA synthetase associated domain-containing protein [Synergistaceae bacterium OttesenSCG-928-D05]|nr:prolyl-tRNA synthetase associated domain-containing protein [Synergistaceae bacterium OttesenSCG-928-D05]
MAGVFSNEYKRKKLRKLGIDFEVTDYNAVFTIEEMKQIREIKIKEFCKNLFLRDDSGKRHFLVILREDKVADLKMIRAQIASSRLGFAYKDRLMKHLGLTKGSVTPFGLLNDNDLAVEVLIDADLQSRPRLGFHLNENTATVWLSFDDLLGFLEFCDNQFVYVKL